MADDISTDTPAAETPATVVEEVNPPELGDAGKQAIDRMKAERDTARKESKDATTELEKLRKQSLSEAERAVAEARTEGERTASERYSPLLKSAQVRALAGGRLADPSDAVSLLDLGGFALSDSGELDVAAVTKALDDLLAAKPYLAPQTSDGRPTGAIGQGKRAESTLDDRIREAEAAHDFKLAGALKIQKLTNPK